MARTEYIARFDDYGAYVESELVRCRDCAHAVPEEPSTRRSRECYQGGFWCSWFGEGVGAFVEPDGYCAWAERKEVTR